MPGMFVAGGVGLLLGLLAPAFHHLTVADHGDVLAIQFGPVPLFRRKVKYTDIEKADVGRTLFVAGWGIHSSIQGERVWNLWGNRACAFFTHVDLFENGERIANGAPTDEEKE